jgi:hypothetical protein
MIIPVACDKNDVEPIYREDLIGTWVNVNNSIDTIKIDNCVVMRIDTVNQRYMYFYNYKIDNDSIELNYFGITSLLVPIIPCQIRFLDEKFQYLKIDDLSQVYPGYPGTEFRRVVTQ